MVERGGLENRYSLRRIQGSNPCLSANHGAARRLPDEVVLAVLTGLLAKAEKTTSEVSEANVQRRD